METEFLVTAVLYQDDDYVVTCTMPAQSPCGAMVRLEVKVRRLRENAGADAESCCPDTGFYR